LKKERRGCRYDEEKGNTMSAAATAAGYLYASGRLRGRAQREQEEAQKAAPQSEPQAKPLRHEVRVAALPPQEAKPRRTPTIQYRTRRWKPDA
jgi:hypothetical protein